MDQPKSGIIIAVNRFNSSMRHSLDLLCEGSYLRDITVVILRDKRTPHRDYVESSKPLYTVKEIETDYLNTDVLEKSLAEPRGEVIGIISRGENTLPFLAKLSELLKEDGLFIPSADALKKSTDKKLMRDAFLSMYPDITPKYVEVKDSSDETLGVCERLMDYPVIVKPANLASSLLIQSCNNRDELQKTLDYSLAQISELYAKNSRFEAPTVIVEEMLTGSLYSVDAYVDAEGKTFLCPPVLYISNKARGIDDFSIYKRVAPTDLSKEDVDSCNNVVAKGVEALGLTNTTTHVELCKIDKGWKIIEIGARPGRYRHEMYLNAFGIDHSTNDIRLRLGLPVDVQPKKAAFCAAYSIYPVTEGLLTAIDGFSEVASRPSAIKVRRIIEDSQEVLYAKHGGHPIAEVIFANDEGSTFQDDCDWFESTVKPIVHPISAD